MEKIFNMTIQRALAEAKRGNVQAMLQVADFYSRKMNREDDHYADNLSLALKWYEKAAQTGDVYALEMTSSGYAIFAEASIQIGAYEDSLREWTQVYRYALPLTSYPGYPRARRRQMHEQVMKSMYKAAYCNCLLNRYDEALDILEKMSPEPYSKEMMLKGICLFEVAEQVRDFEIAYDALGYFDSLETFDCIRNAVDELEELVFAKGYMFLSIYYRTGLAGIFRNMNRAYSILSIVSDKVTGDMAWNVIQGELSHYRRKLFGGYQYIE
ncbi:MAG: hypothetical protein K1W23_04250 [Lachnospiraceae bacterium]